jgi:hypothetical protein
MSVPLLEIFYTIRVGFLSEARRLTAAVREF